MSAISGESIVDLKRSSDGLILSAVCSGFFRSEIDKFGRLISLWRQSVHTKI